MSKVIADIYKGDSRIVSLTIRKESDIMAGKLNTSLASESVTEIDVLTTSSYLPPPSVGHLVLTNAAKQTQTIPYTAWESSGNVYTFTVDSTLDWTFTALATTVDIDPARVDITGATIVMTAKVNATAEASLTATAMLSNPTAGEATISLTPTDTNIDACDYIFDIQMTTSDGDVATLAKSILTILHEVTV